MSRRAVLCLRIVPLLLLGCLVQGARADPPDDLEDFRAPWRWARFSIADGLPSEHVNGLTEADDGTVWAATERGIAWFDGYRWNTPQGPGAVPSARVLDVLPHGDGRVYAKLESRLFLGGTDGFHEVPLPPSQGPRGDWFLIRTKDGSLLGKMRDWFRVTGKAVSVGTGSSDTASLAGDIGSWTTRSGRAFVSDDAGVAVLEGGRLEPVVALPRNQSVALVQEHSRGLGVAAVVSPVANRGLWVWDAGEPAAIAPCTRGLVVHAVDIADDGTIFGILDSGEGLVRRPDGRWSRTLLPAALGYAHSVRFARDGNVWVASDRGAWLLRRSSGRWTILAHPSADPRNHVSSILRRRNGDLWIGSSGGLDIVRDGVVAEHVDEVLGTTVADVTGMLEDREGAVWISSGGAFRGALRLREDTWSHIGESQGIDAFGIHTIREDRRGRVVLLGLGSQSHGLEEPGAYIRGDDGTFERLLPPGDPVWRRTYDFLEARDGSYWLATRGGVCRLRRGEWTCFDERFAGAPDTAFALAEDPDGRIWVGSRYSGLTVIDEDDGLERYGPEEGLLHGEVWGLSCAPDGAIWATTGLGLSRLENGIWASILPEHGMPAARAWPLLTGPDGLVVGTAGRGVGILRFEAADRAPPSVRFHPSPVERDSALVRWDVRAFMGGAPAESIQTRSRADGGPWSDWSTERELTLRRLRPGGHAVEVQAKGLYGEPAAPVRLDLEIEPPLVQRPVFIGPVLTLALALVVTGALLLHRRARHLRDLRASERALARQAQILRQVGESVIVVDPDGRILDVNPAAVRFTGHDRPGLQGMLLARLLLPSAAERILGEILAAAAQDRPWQGMVDLVLRDGTTATCDARFEPLRDERGKVIAAVGVFHDVTERIQMEEELRQAQKMEAVGQLTGGVAHDFNNILAVIVGSLDLMAVDLSEGTRPHRLAQQALQAAERGADLTQRLLAFSRKQPLQPRPVDLNKLVGRTSELLRRTLGETICVEAVRSGGLWRCQADPTQLENTLLNLALNSRDAMPGGGKLTIETANARLDAEYASRSQDVEPGQYVMLAVTDTGTGMAPEVMERVFDPFFTTKEFGRGSGLGLAMVYGFVKQSHGHIRVYSEVGQGTTFKIYLPRTRESDEDPQSVELPDSIPRGRGELVLLVEDDEDLRRLGVRMLTRLGYEAVSAGDGPTALQAVEQHGDIALLFTDIVLPGGMSGRDLAEEAGRVRPGLPVLFTSGYTENSMVHDGRLDSGVELLEKPYRIASLARRLRDVLGARRTTDG